MSRLEFQPDPEQEPEDDAALQAEEQAAQNRLALPGSEAAAASETAVRLQQVEELLRNAPLLSVPIGFADRVLAVIKGQDQSDPDYQDAMGIVLGLLLAALIALPLFGTLAYLIGRAIVSASARTVLVSDLEAVLSSIFVWLQGLSLGAAVLLPIALVILVALGLLSGYVFRFFWDVMKAGSSE